MSQTLCLAARQTRLVLSSRDHLSIGIDAGFAIHRERVGPGPGREVCRVNRQCLVFVTQVEIRLQVATMNRLCRLFIAAIVLKLEIPPPFFDLV